MKELSSFRWRLTIAVGLTLFTAPDAFAGKAQKSYSAFESCLLEGRRSPAECEVEEDARVAKAKAGKARTAITVARRPNLLRRSRR